MTTWYLIQYFRPIYTQINYVLDHLSLICLLYGLYYSVRE
jgi:hypothetical protein